MLFVSRRNDTGLNKRPRKKVNQRIVLNNVILLVLQTRPIVCAPARSVAGGGECSDAKLFFNKIQKVYLYCFNK